MKFEEDKALKFKSYRGRASMLLKAELHGCKDSASTGSTQGMEKERKETYSPHGVYHIMFSLLSSPCLGKEASFPPLLPPHRPNPRQ